MFDDRLRILSEELGRIVYPSVKECWLYESKLRAREWLDAHRLPHPRTWVFHDRGEAIRFARTAPLPIVYKTNSGGSASGVRILRDRRRLTAIIRRAFDVGIAPSGQGPVERQAGVVYLQEYLPNVNEWRMVRIGDSFFGYRKERGDGEFHSASHSWSWLDPPRTLLDFLRKVTDMGQFTSMSVDVFETTNGGLLVNELHTVFGASTPVDQLRVNGRPGRYVYREPTDEWVFEEGDYSRNACSNLRVSYLLGTVLPRAATVAQH
jgi:glutathione synthase/RimK-type ligase-like ATP-grasp enzyme